jgi:tetratricopeptide (TPR) repeat protein
MRGAPEAVAALVGVATTAQTGNPFAGAAAQQTLRLALNAILDDKAEELNQLSRANVEALVNGPYKTGMEYLNQAVQEYRKPKDREKFIDEAFNQFMSAHGQQEHQFRKALIQYQLGNCSALLGHKEDARQWFRRSYESAAKYLYDRSDKVRAAAGPQMTKAGMALPEGGFAAIIKHRQMKREFLEEAPAVLDLLDDLGRLQEETGEALNLKFDDILDDIRWTHESLNGPPLPEKQTLEDWLNAKSQEQIDLELLSEVRVDTIIPTHRTETVVGTDKYPMRNTSPGTVTRRLTLEKTWSQSWRLNYSDPESGGVDYGGASGAIGRIHRTNLDLVIAKRGAFRQVRQRMREIEEQLRARYAITESLTDTYTEELMLPPDANVVATITWRKIWQHGVVRLTDGEKVPFKIAVQLTCDLNLDKVTSSP